MNFETIVGIEIHVEMKTKSKMFSLAPIKFGLTPNTEVVPMDMAFPGTMPRVNKEAVRNAIRVSHALHMSIDQEIWFDRKNYFYSDLQKVTKLLNKLDLSKVKDILKLKWMVKRRKLLLKDFTWKKIHVCNTTLVTTH